MVWREYLDRFHRERAGVTEQVLSASHSRDGLTPYEWLRGALPPTGVMLDLACGSAPVWSPRLRGRYIGTDVSADELSLATARGAGPLVRADAVALPFATGSVSVVACSMGLMILPDLADVLGEIRRVLRPDGLVVATLPAAGPLAGRDLLVAAGLLGALGRRLGYPNDAALSDAGGLCARAGLRVCRDELRRFVYPLSPAGAAGVLVESLYLPSIAPARTGLARSWLRVLRWFGVPMPVPIRRLVAEPA